MKQAKKYEIFIQDEKGNRVWSNKLLETYEEVQKVREILSNVGLSVYDAEKLV